MEILPLLLPLFRVGSEIGESVKPLLISTTCLVKGVYPVVGANLLKLPAGGQDVAQIKFYAWSRNLNQPIKAFVLTQGEEAKLKELYHGFPGLAFFTIFHDAGDKGNATWINKLAEAILYGTYYEYCIIFSPDYETYAGTSSQAVMNIDEIANQTALFLNWAYKFANVLNYFVVGHGIGANIAQRAEEMRLKLNATLKVFVFEVLDPFFLSNETRPTCYNYTFPEISVTIAKQVHVIHASSCSRLPLIPACNSSSNSTVGHHDFFPNGGAVQPGCSKDDLLCNRKRATDLFIEVTVNNNTQPSLYGFLCENFTRFESGKCGSCNVCPIPGLGYFQYNSPGRYYMYTNAISPFGRGGIITKP